MAKTAGELRACGYFVSDDIGDEVVVRSYDTTKQIPGSVIHVRIPGRETPPDVLPGIENKAVQAAPENKSTKKPHKKGEK